MSELLIFPVLHSRNFEFGGN